jgi:predicted RNA binding protein YcfA (HicA-like mRNA interferase family)
MKIISGKVLKSILEKKGWIHHRTTGSHWIYKNIEMKEVVSIPIHGNKDLPIGTLKRIMKDTNLTEEDLK